MVTNQELVADCYTADQLAKRWKKSKYQVLEMARDKSHPLKPSAFSRRPLYFHMNLVRNIEEGRVTTA